jgi:urease subunit gamma/beta
MTAKFACLQTKDLISGGEPMILTPTELERLVIFTAAELARKRRAKGLKLNHPETVAYITDEILEGAREGRSVAELISFGSELLTQDDVMPGVADLLPVIQVEGTFPDGTKLVTVHDPVRPGKRKQEGEVRRPGELVAKDGSLELNPGRRRETLKIVNTGDRPIQIGSHYHIFEANRALEFDREKAFGMRLDIPAGTAVRFEPGESKKVTLTEFGGTRELHGLNGLTNGSARSQGVKDAAMQRAKERGFRGA